MNKQLKAAADAILNGAVSSEPRVPGVVAMITDRDRNIYEGAAGQRIVAPYSLAEHVADVAIEGIVSLPAVEPVYRLTAELSPKVVRRAVAGALDRLPELPEWLSPDLVAARGWPGFTDAVLAEL